MIFLFRTSKQNTSPKNSKLVVYDTKTENKETLSKQHGVYTRMKSYVNGMKFQIEIQRYI